MVSGNSTLSGSVVGAPPNLDNRPVKLDGAERALDEGNWLLTEGAPAAAADAYRRGLAQLPADRRDGVLAAHLFNGLGNAERRDGRFEAAATTLEQALAIFQRQDPASAGTGAVLNNLGYVLLSAGDLDGAAQRLQEA